jgi:hypothetical protein
LLSEQHPGQKLSMSYLAHVADDLETTLAYVQARIADASLTTALWLSRGGVRLSMTRNPSEHAGIQPSRDQVRAVCRLFRVDYLALALPHPPECDDLFDGRPTGLADLPHLVGPLAPT